MVLKSIGVLSAAKIVGVMYAVLGLLMGLIFAAVFSFLPAGIDGGPNEMPGWFAPMFGAGSIIFMPIMYGIIGFIGGAISAVIYNALAGMIGGLVLRVEPAPQA